MSIDLAGGFGATAIAVAIIGARSKTTLMTVETVREFAEPL
jgi:hypothetical protein